MGWRRAGGVVLGVLALATATAGAGAAASPTRAQVQLMPLPRAAFGAPAGSLALDSSSGWTSNKDAADNDIGETMTEAKLTGMGRMTGFEVDFDDLAAASRPGRLIYAGSSADLFRSASASARYLAFEASEFKQLDGKPLPSGIRIEHVSFFDVPGLANALGVHYRIRMGGLTLWATGAQFQAGTLAASAELARTDNRNVNAEVQRLSRALSARIDGVLAGRVHDRPLASAGPKLGGLGRPAGGPDLTLMAIQPADFPTVAKAKHQGYQRNPDDVAEYVREFGGAIFDKTLLTTLEADVELLPTVKAAADGVAILRLAFGGPHGGDLIRQAIFSGLPADKRKAIKVGTISSARIAAGDESFAFEAGFVANGIAFKMVICFVQRGPVVETLTLVGLPTVPRSTITKLARIASAHIDQALHP